MSQSAETPPLTRNQQLVFDALIDAAAPMTAYEILDALRDAGFRAPLQVYRALDKLKGLGLVHRLESLNAFVACAEPHHHKGATVFAICDNCGDTQEFTDDAVANRLERRADEQAFTLQRATVELHGLCRRCARVQDQAG